MEQRTRRRHFGDFFLWRGDFRAVCGAVVLAEDQRGPPRVLLVLRRDRLQRRRDWLFHQLVFDPQLRRVEEVRVDLAVVIGRPHRPDASQLADVPNFLWWMESVGRMLWQFDFGIRRRRVGDELEVVQVFRQRR